MNRPPTNPDEHPPLPPFFCLSFTWFISTRKLFFLAAIWLVFMTTAHATETNTLLFADHFERGLEGRWQQVKFGPPTDYTVLREGTNTCLQAVADKTCSALMTRLNLPPPPRLRVRWRWKIDHVPARSTDRITRSFDHTARVIIAFDTLLGPPRTVNYIWANQESIGTTLPHPLSGWAQMIVLQTGNQRAGEWITEEREVTADWRQLFGDRAMPKIVGIGVITDSENTGTHVTGWYQNLELLAE